MKKKTIFTNNRFMISKNLILMLALLVVAFISIFAWYYIKRDVSATGVTVEANPPDEIEIAPEIYDTVNNTKVAKIGSWGQTLTINNSENFKFSTDVSSNGKTFIIPAFSATEKNSEAMQEAMENGKIVNPDGVPTVAKNNLSLSQDEIDDGIKGDYYTLPFYIKSRKKNIVLKPDCYLAMAVEKGPDSQGNTAIISENGENIARKSLYGNFTSDAIVAAMRVSLVGKSVASIENSVPSMLEADSFCNFLWNPRPDLFLNIPYNSNNTDWNLITEVVDDDTIYRLRDVDHSLTYPGTDMTGKTYEHSYYMPVYNGANIIGSKLITESVNGYHASDLTKPVTDGTVGDNSVPTLGVTAELIPQNYQRNNNAIDGYYVYRFELNLWIEGTDTEARRAMDTGQFKLFLKFGSN